MYVTCSICDELSTVSGPEFTANVTRQFLKDLRFNHRLSIVAFPHSNCRVEVGVKTVKRMLMNNTGPWGSLDADAFQRAMLKYRNRPSSPLRNVCSDAPYVTWTLLSQAATLPGGKHWKHARKPWGTATCEVLNDGVNTLVAYLLLLLATMSVCRIKLPPILKMEQNWACDKGEAIWPICHQSRWVR